MVIKEVFKEGVSFLGNSLNASLDAEVLLQYVLKQPKEYLIAHDDEDITKDLIDDYFNLLLELKSGKPVAYVVNNKGFYGRDFYVDEKVLIPRPETEMLVDKVKKICSIDTRIYKILDVGTGCGNIAISLANELRNLEIDGVDISKEALVVAQKNIKQIGSVCDVNFFKSDLLDGIDFVYDLVVCNLPYIGKAEFGYVEENVKKFEPNLALFSGDDGLGQYRRLFEQIKTLKNKPKLIIGEYGFKQQEELIKKFVKDFGEVSFYNDLGGNPRMFVVKL